MTSPHPPPLKGGHTLAGGVSALYLHVPFCRSICPFCAFAVHGNRQGLHAGFLEAITAEMAAAGRAHAAGEIHTCYVGGGTPSTLAPAEAARLLEAAGRAFRLAGGVEITWELNPEDVTAEYLKALSGLGVTRISIGLQSLDAGVLRGLGRGHDARQSRQALECAAAHWPGGNYNVDLMFGAPGQTLADFAADVHALLALRPAHVSLYALDIEPGTRMARLPALRRGAEEAGAIQPEAFLWAAGALGGRMAQQQVQAGRTAAATATRCDTVMDSEVRVKEYEVRYDIGGAVATVRMPYDPGERIPLSNGTLLI